MSTKLYHAWRIPLSNLNEFIVLFREKAFDFAATMLGPIMDAAEKEKIQQMLKDNYKDEKIARFVCAIDVIKKLAKLKTRTPGLDLDVSLNIWIDADLAYIVPVGEEYFANIIYSIKKDWKETYCYWNNTDRPDYLTEEQWEEREQNWYRICLKDHNKTRLNYSVIDFRGFYGDFDAQCAIKKRIFGSEEVSRPEELED